MQRKPCTGYRSEFKLETVRPAPPWHLQIPPTKRLGYRASARTVRVSCVRAAVAQIHWFRVRRCKRNRSSAPGE